MEKPVPWMVAPLMVSGAVPLEVSRTVCVAGVFTLTLPKATLVEPRVRAGVPLPAGFNCRVSVSELLLSNAVSVAVCAEVTAVAIAVKTALDAPEATMTEAGNWIAPLLLLRFTVTPRLPAACVSVTLHASVPAPVMEAVTQVSALNGWPELV
ncbi:MAG: hypothetical protein ACLGXA_13515 [Acidobacteriota bacterium]